MRSSESFVREAAEIGSEYEVGSIDASNIANVEPRRTSGALCASGTAKLLSMTYN